MLNQFKGWVANVEADLASASRPSFSSTPTPASRPPSLENLDPPAKLAKLEDLCAKYRLSIVQYRTDADQASQRESQVGVSLGLPINHSDCPTLPTSQYNTYSLQSPKSKAAAQEAQAQLISLQRLVASSPSAADYHELRLDRNNLEKHLHAVKLKAKQKIISLQTRLDEVRGPSTTPSAGSTTSTLLDLTQDDLKYIDAQSRSADDLVKQLSSLQQEYETLASQIPILKEENQRLQIEVELFSSSEGQAQQLQILQKENQDLIAKVANMDSIKLSESRSESRLESRSESLPERPVKSDYEQTLEDKLRKLGEIAKRQKTELDRIRLELQTTHNSHSQILDSNHADSLEDKAKIVTLKQHISQLQSQIALHTASSTSSASSSSSTYNPALPQHDTSQLNQLLAKLDSLSASIDPLSTPIDPIIIETLITDLQQLIISLSSSPSSTSQNAQTLLLTQQDLQRQKALVHQAQDERTIASKQTTALTEKLGELEVQHAKLLRDFDIKSLVLSSRIDQSEAPEIQAWELEKSKMEIQVSVLNFVLF